ncbi:MauE/DoxX family redox-associated membrane protein [Parapedobacter sp. DT-150]|uniref:MauE/DoxX family redox-associated membrane protein n=1 Tax=Parapedobacter sp. DT-150 TaxID=3396162 RepID=UPI003F1B16A0
MSITKKPFTNTITSLIRLALLALWVPVAADKLWDLTSFHSTLLRQPFPSWWADVLFWLLPLLELAAAVLIAWPRNRQRQHQGTWLSAVLMLGFTLFILFGVLGWYEKRPCGCGSVISGLSWEEHLWFNAAYLLLAVLGIRLTRPQKTDGERKPHHKATRLFGGKRITNHIPIYRTLIMRLRFPRKFALFRRRP